MRPATIASNTKNFDTFLNASQRSEGRSTQYLAKSMPYIGADGQVVEKRSPFRLSIISDFFWTVINILGKKHCDRRYKKEMTIISSF